MDLGPLAELIQERNRIEERVTKIIGRPASLGHLGEFIASRIFDIELASSATHKSLDGWFRSGPYEGQSVNIKWYARHEGLLDIAQSEPPDTYLVLTGPSFPPLRAVGARPWLVAQVFLFESSKLEQEITARHVGIATSVRKSVWARARIFPDESPLWPLSEAQRGALNLFQ